jgi:nicotinamidase-related amidase/type 1 glutamine amidotransferase
LTAAVRRLVILMLGVWSTLPHMPTARAEDATLVVHTRRRVEQNGDWVPRDSTESWDPRATAVIVCDVWDAHHCLSAVRRVEEMAPRMNEVLRAARSRGVLVIHAPSGCMAAYEGHPARERARTAPTAANLPADIGAWCRRIPAEERVEYPVDQSDGGEDDDPVEHEAWHRRLAGLGRNPRAPWLAQLDALEITADDAISDSGVEIWNLLESRGIANVVLLGVHTNMCVLGRPFGLRQLARHGRNVVLMRDMTDTMYNPRRWPYVTHHVGTERVVEHVERVVCPTMTSVDFLGGEPFRFRDDRRSIVMLIGEDEYRTAETLPEFAATELEPAGFRVTAIHSSPDDPRRFPGLRAALAEADLLLVSVRRRPPPQEDLDAIRAHVAAGRPLVGIRTASHAFSPRRGEALPAGHGTWPDFDPRVLGGRYVGHHGAGPATSVSVSSGAAGHPILVDIDVAKLVGHGSLYRVAPLEPSATALLSGVAADHPAEPVAWTNTPREGGSRVFYTSFGHVDDFRDPEFRRLLLQGICWTLGIAPPPIAALRADAGASAP